MADRVVPDTDVIYHLREIKTNLVKAFKKAFTPYPDQFKVSEGDIFEGAPAVDAIVCPANSFGFLEGGVATHCAKYFGPQLQERLQKVIRTEFDGELLVGQVAIIPAYGEEGRNETADWSKFNEGQPIKYLISAPTMRVPMDVSDTANIYLVFRAILLAVRQHNCKQDQEPIRSVLIPGLGTGVIGMMPPKRCAMQMLQAYETFVKNLHPTRLVPKSLKNLYSDHEKMCEYGQTPEEKANQELKEIKLGMLTSSTTTIFLSS